MNARSRPLLDGGVVRCRAVLFDLDGVLVDSMRVVHRTWAWWAETRGLDVDVVARASRGGPAVETVRQAAPHLDAEREAALLSDYEADAVDEIRPFPGARDLLNSILSGRGRERWGIVTSGVGRVAQGRIGGTGLPDPPVLISADDVTWGKPHPECYLRAAAALGFESRDCLVVEDGPGGITAALAAGMEVIAVASTRAPDELSEAHAVVPALTSLAVSHTDVGFVVRTT